MMGKLGDTRTALVKVIIDICLKFVKGLCQEIKKATRAIETVDFHRLRSCI